MTKEKTISDSELLRRVEKACDELASCCSVADKKQRKVIAEMAKDACHG